MSYPLIERLSGELGYPEVNENNLQDLLGAHEFLLLFFPGNPQRYPESLDVAVILPELVTAFNQRFQPVVVTIEDEPAMKERFPFAVWPSLVMLRRGVQVGTIDKVQDWSVYLEKLEEMLAINEPEAAIPSVTI